MKTALELLGHVGELDLTGDSTGCEAPGCVVCDPNVGNVQLWETVAQRAYAEGRADGIKYGEYKPGEDATWTARAESDPRVPRTVLDAHPLERLRTATRTTQAEPSGDATKAADALMERLPIKDGTFREQLAAAFEAYAATRTRLLSRDVEILTDECARKDRIQAALNDAVEATRAPVSPPASQDGRVPLALDEYEATNLRAGLLALRGLGLDTGDWLGQLLYRIPESTLKPNVETAEQVEQVRRSAVGPASQDARAAAGLGWKTAEFAEPVSAEVRTAVATLCQSLGWTQVDRASLESFVTSMQKRAVREALAARAPSQDARAAAVSPVGWDAAACAARKFCDKWAKCRVGIGGVRHDLVAVIREEREAAVREALAALPAVTGDATRDAEAFVGRWAAYFRHGYAELLIAEDAVAHMLTAHGERAARAEALLAEAIGLLTAADRSECEVAEGTDRDDRHGLEQCMDVLDDDGKPSPDTIAACWEHRCRDFVRRALPPAEPLPAAEYHVCPNCGPRVMVNEDAGDCTRCGSETTVVDPAEPPPTAPPNYGPGRCEVCGWPLKERMEDGCIPGNCSYRPDDPDEQRRIRTRREQLAAAKAEPPPAARPGKP